MKNLTLCVAFAACVARAAIASTPGNLIPNGDFASSIVGWTCSGKCIWENEGATDDGTGSIEFPFITEPNIATATSSCFAIAPQTTYTAGFQVAENKAGLKDEFAMMCNTFSDADCTDVVNSYSPAEVFYTSEGFGWEAATPGTFTTAANDRFAVCLTTGGGNGTIGYDDIYVVPPDQIFLDGFDG